MIGFSMMIAAGLAAAVQGDPAPTVQTQDIPLGTINIPDEIAPAIIPYFQCQMDSHGVRRGPPGSSQITPSADRVGARCNEARIEAARRGEAMLRAQNRGSAVERQAYVERVMANVDRFVATLQAPLQASNREANAKN